MNGIVQITSIGFNPNIIASPTIIYDYIITINLYSFLNDDLLSYTFEES